MEEKAQTEKPKRRTTNRMIKEELINLADCIVSMAKALAFFIETLESDQEEFKGGHEFAKLKRKSLDVSELLVSLRKPKNKKS